MGVPYLDPWYGRGLDFDRGNGMGSEIWHRLAGCGVVMPAGREQHAFTGRPMLGGTLDVNSGEQPTISDRVDRAEHMAREGS